MSCRFYGASIHFGQIVPNPGSNQCGRITDAHSPCWMDVAEQREPDWEACPRNGEIVPAGDDIARFLEYDRHMKSLLDLRKAMEPRSRAEHLVFAKERALPYLDRGDLAQAYSSMVSDLMKHYEIGCSQILQQVGFVYLVNGDARSLRGWIEGFE